MITAPSSQSQYTLEDIAKASGSASLASSSAKGLDDNFNMFLSLLTTQLKNQNPLEPMDADKFTQQLTQYSGIEQQIKSNSLLSDVIGQLSANSMMSVLGFMNTEITAGGSTSTLADGKATWTLQNPTQLTVTGDITIKNAKGETVYNQNYTLNPGEQAFNWNGRDKNGIALPDGDYTISVEAKDSTSSLVKIGSQTKGIVTGIDFSGSAPIILVGDKRLRIADITSVATVKTH